MTADGGEENMLEKRIRLRTVDDICELVRAAEKCDFDVGIVPESRDTSAGLSDKDMRASASAARPYHMSVNAKSIIGVISMDLTSVLTVKYGAQDGTLEKVLQKFSVMQSPASEHELSKFSE